MTMNACPCLSNCPTPAADLPHYVRKSVYEECLEEENRYKWIESEKAGYDLGEGAIQRWVKEHWTGYLRARWVEHLQGKCFWIELDRGDYGLLQREFRDQQPLLDAILDRLKSGKENLDVINWACTSEVPIAPVLQILTELDVNSRRLAHRFEAELHRIESETKTVP